MTILDLFESMAPGILYHYTNVLHLKNILQTGKIQTSKKYGGVSFVRPSMTHQDMKMLSRNIGKVRFIIDRSKITSGKIRGLKIEKIAEYPQKFKKAIEARNITKEDIKKFREGKMKRYDDNYVIIANYLDSLKNREGEEKSNISIPIKYTKIELLPGFTEQLENSLSKFEVIKTIRLIKQYKNLFIKNKEFRKIENK